MAKKVKNTSKQKYIVHDNLDKIGEIPIYYGFLPHRSPDIKKIDLDNAKSLLEGDFLDDIDKDKKSLPLHVEEKIALLRNYSEENMQNLSQPVMLYFKEPFKGSIKKGSVSLGD